ncbi:MAG: hypothetical protein JMDDDDMK_00241 [Acidobacteria bacterium]|nr:hypothetical protein [Acidobacteriota bacterium]
MQNPVLRGFGFGALFAGFGADIDFALTRAVDLGEFPDLFFRVRERLELFIQQCDLGAVDRGLAQRGIAKGEQRRRLC